jgi:hypothetical protein
MTNSKSKKIGRNPKDEAGRRKPGLGRIPQSVLYEVGVVADHGAGKYGPMNWVEEEISSSVYLDAARRHLSKFEFGEDNDDETNVSHLSHAIAGLCILRDAYFRGCIIDDRPPSLPDGWMDLIAKGKNLRTPSKKSEE